MASTNSPDSERDDHPPDGDRHTETSGKAPFPIIGVGASAGGLEAFSQLLANVPDNTGMAFVLVQHLDPKHESKLGDILARATRMPVLEAVHGMEVRPDHVYVIPPNTTISIAEGILQLGPRELTRGVHLPIDQFFRSLAADRQTAAIGVILSGTGSDGTLGLEEIKAAGGITFAQDERTARHSGMPESAIRSGCVDVVLSPQAIARELVRIAQHPYVVPAARAAEAVPSGEESHFKKILTLLHSSFGVDFGAYRDTTVRRRIMRRMVLHTKDTLADYARHLETDRAELEALYQDILINVTSFFREPATFEALKQTVFPEVLKSKTPDAPVRIWAPGCSTGQEAYSLAIALLEFLDEKSLRVPVQIFATDLSDTVSLQRAREGIYPANIEAEVSPERLWRFFTQENGKYRINKAIRDVCVFAKQNVAADPPFSRVDMISCRNLLIYLAPPLQKRVIPTFHYALNPQGFLVLGASETIGPFTDLFGLVDHKHRIYVKKATAARPYPHFSAPHLQLAMMTGTRPPAPPAATSADWQREADRLLLGQYAPPGVLVADNLDILQFRGQTSAYLTPAPGEASLNVLKMAREGLFVELRAALNEARQRHVEVRRQGVRVRSDDHFREVNLRVVPVKMSGTGESCFLILFEEPGRWPGAAATVGAGTETAEIGAGATAVAPARQGLFARLRRWFAPAAAAPSAAAFAASERENAHLRQELASTREYLQSVIEQQEATNEELKSANEEILSANEELQSTNEELETAKEELQSVNEELTTINEQLNTRNTELTRLNDDIHNLLASANICMVAVGMDLRIRRFTPAAAKLLNLLPTDARRPIGNLKPTIEVPNLQTLIAEVIASVQPSLREAHDEQGRRYDLRIFPYRTADNKIDGAVVVLVDVSERRRGEEARSELAAVIESSPDAIISKTLEGTITSWNKGAERLYGYSEAEILGKPISLLIPPDNPDELPGIMERLKEGERIANYETVRRRKDGQTVHVSVSISPIHDAADRIVGAAAIARDVSASKRLADQLKEADRRKNEFLAMLSHELRNPLAPLRNGLQVLQLAGQTTPEAQHTQEMMARQVEHLSRLIEDLLDMSRVTHGRIELRKEPVDLVELVRHALEACSPSLTAAQHTLDVQLPAEPIIVDGDPVRIVQIAENLLTNAIKYSKRAGQISVAVERDGDEAVLRVRDVGDGIPPDLLPRIWDLFMQGDASEQHRRGGLGIGLTLVRSLVALHGGRVEAHSDGPGKGSEFVVRLPLLAGASADSAVKEIPKESAGDVAPVSGRSILVVDDNADAARTLAMLLRLLGNEVRTAFDGPSALAAASERRPDIIVLDIGLPGMDGYEVARRLRHDFGPDNMKLIALSGYGGEEDRRRSLEAGFDAHLVKPADVNALRNVLAKR